MPRYKFTDKEVTTILKNLVIIYDTREQVNAHVLEKFKAMKIKTQRLKLDYGDYSIKIESNESTKPLGVTRDWYFINEIAVERKNSVNELVDSIKDRDRFSNEFLRASHYSCKVLAVIEDQDTIQRCYEGQFRSDYRPESLVPSLFSFMHRFNLQILPLKRDYTAKTIAGYLKYGVREILKNKGMIITKENDNIYEIDSQVIQAIESI